MNAEVVRVLREARELISDEKRWTKGALARNECGDSTRPKLLSAVRWCADGALMRVAPSPRLELAAGVTLERAAEAVFKTSDYVWLNDTKTHAAILRVFDRAIELAEASA